MVLTQDGTQRNESVWLFYKYDALNRRVLTGMMETSAGDLETMQAAVNAHYANGAPWGEEFSQTGPIHGYSNNTYPVVTSGTVSDPNHYVSVTYYDNYNFINQWIDDYAYSPEGLTETVNGVLYEEPDEESVRVKGQVTGSKTKVLDGGVRGRYSWLKSVSYYDDKYRLIQSVTDNYKGGQDRTTNLYDFTGKVLETKTSHTTYEISWKDLVNTIVQGNNLVKTASGAGWTAGAVTVEELAAGVDGWIECIISEPDQKRAFGLTATNEGQHRNTIDYAFWHDATAAAIFEDGDLKYQLPGPVESGDVIRIKRTGTQISYYRNGVLVYPLQPELIEQEPSTTALIGDASIDSGSGNILVPRASFNFKENYVQQRFVYDHAGRLKEVWHGINSEPETLRITYNEYNELGQLIDKKLHSTDPTASDAVQSVDYRYNIRGWLTDMNEDDLAAGGQGDPADYFSFQLAYNEVDPGIGNEALFNGNISAMKWNANLGLGDEKMNAYKYSYDEMNRITGAAFRTATGIPGSLAWSTPAGDAFTARGYSYDLNGNITQLVRKGKNGAHLDSLDYDYGIGAHRSNQLLTVTDGWSKTEGFTEGSSEGDDYVYDDNGNLVWDKNKGGKEVLINGDFTNGGANWVVADPVGRLVFQDDAVEISAHATEDITLRQNDVILRRAAYVVIIDMVTVSGGIVINVGSGGNHSVNTSGKTVLSCKSVSGNDLVVKIPSTFAGRINSIEVKGIVVIDYNFLNLPEFVSKGPEQQIRYIYDATGRKVSQELYNEGGLIVKKSDYEGAFFYENDTLKFINHQEGRAVMVGDQPEYQYHLKDHLGNVRLTFTTKEETEAPTATLEPENETEEYNNFLRYENARKVQSFLFDRTNDSSPTSTDGYAQRLSGGENEKFGLGRSLSVMPGDKITAEVYAKYVDPVSGNRTEGLNILLSQIAQQIATGATSSGLVIDGGNFGTSTTSFPFPIEAAQNTTGSSGDGPKAYLNWLVFDRDYNFLLDQSGYKRLSADPKETGQDVAHERLFSPQIEIQQPGYVYIYLSNESETLVEVYFDDFTVEHIKSPVVQMDDYYPFGLTFNSYQRENAVEQRYLYNTKELQDELNLGWLDYGARMHMPDLGRFFKQDRFSEKYFALSPYQYAANNPIKFIDVNGDSLWIRVNKNNTALYEDGKLYNADGSSYSGKGVKKDGSLRGFLAKTVGALEGVRGTSATGFGLLKDLQGSQNSFTIVRGADNGFTADNTARAAANLGEFLGELGGLPNGGSGGTISFNPSQTLGGPDVNGSRTRPIFVGLAHELFHASDANFGILYPDNDYSNPRTGFYYSATIDGLEKNEISAVRQENQLRNETGLPLRQYYGIHNGQPTGPRLVPFFLHYATYLFR